MDESTGPGSTFDAQVCVAWEAAAREAEKVGVRVVVVRTGLVLDPEHGLLKQLLLPFKLGVGGPLAGGAQYMPWIHVDDEVRLLLWALDTDQASGTYNAAAPNPVTNREFSKALGRVLGRPAVVPGTQARAQGQVRRRARRGRGGWPAHGSPPRPGRRLRVPPPRASNRRWRTCCGADGHLRGPQRGLEARRGRRRAGIPRAARASCCPPRRSSRCRAPNRDPAVSKKASTTASRLSP